MDSCTEVRLSEQETAGYCAPNRLLISNLAKHGFKRGRTQSCRRETEVAR